MSSDMRLGLLVFATSIIPATSGAERRECEAHLQQEGTQTRFSGGSGGLASVTRHKSLPMSQL